MSKIRFSLLLGCALFSWALPASAELDRRGMFGDWKCEIGTLTAYLSFHEDGGFEGRMEQDKEVVWRFAGKWKLDEDQLKYEYTESSLERIPVGSKDADTLLELDEDYYVIRSKEGKKRRYERISTDEPKR